MDTDKLLTCDTECYVNYFLVMFRKKSTGEVIYFEKFKDSPLDITSILGILNKYTLLTFNGEKYDQVMLEAACRGYSNAKLKEISDFLIVGDNGKGNPPWKARKQFGIGKVEIDQIDLIEVCPLKASLKIYGGRRHARTLQDLPLEPSHVMQESDLPDMREYCENDLDLTDLIFDELKEELDLRVLMSKKYKVDLRSKSDAQMAESIIKHHIEEKYNVTINKPKIKTGTTYFYKAPKNIKFESDDLNYLLEQYESQPIVVDKAGYTTFNFEFLESDKNKKGDLPKTKPQLKFRIDNTDYKAGIGGLHSCEKSTRHTNDKHTLRDYDVKTFYPRVILNNELCPKHIGKPFLNIYNKIVETRLKAKLEKDKVTDATLKIVINGSFGKLGSKWSIFYSPDLMLQVTITGQLTLLMLIERLSLAGIEVISANTDGIVAKIPHGMEDLSDSIVEEWEFDTNYEMESADYVSLNSRDVNNYIAIKDGSSKGKGAYADLDDHYYKLRSNPTNTVCVEAVKAYLTDGTKIEETVKSCEDIRKFTNLRTVNGGAVYEGELIGKAIRWYYSTESLDCIRYKTSGNKVPTTEGAVPMMTLSEELPSDLDYQWYINEARRILKQVGVKDK